MPLPYKKITYTAHSEIRMKFRYIYEEWVENALRNPDKISDVKGGRKKAVRRINGDKISVIYVDELNTIIVITVYWGE